MDAVARFELPTAFGFDGPRAAFSDDCITSSFSVRAATEAVRRTAVTVGKQRHARRHQRFNLADDAAASAPSPASAGACADAIGAYAQRVSVFESFSRSVEAIGHVRVDAAQ